MGFVKFTGGLLLILGISAVSLLLLPGIHPNHEFKSFRIEPPKKELLKLLDSNNILDEAELYYEGPNSGIESIVELDDRTIIGGDLSGAIFKITGKQTAKNITHLKYPCKIPLFGLSRQECSWPLGMQQDKEGNIVLQDFFGGMVKVDIKTGLYETLVPMGTKLNGRGTLPNDLSIAKDGSIYWSDVAIDGDFVPATLMEPDGRLIKYDPKKKTNQILLDDIHFPNGVCVSDNDEFVLVSELGSSSIRRYYLKGDKKGTSDTFINGLPGYPDNIRPNGRGGFYVALWAVWNDEFTWGFHWFSERPLLRKFILRLRRVLITRVTHLKTWLPDGTEVYINQFEKYILELPPTSAIDEKPKLVTVVELSKTGEVLGILNGKSGKMPNLSQLTAGKEYGYLVCPFDNKIWRIKMETLRNVNNKK